MSTQVIQAPHVSFTIAEMENGFKVSEGEVQEKFAWLNDVTRHISGHDSRLFTCAESPDKVFQLGGWRSVEEHYQHLHSTPLVYDILDEFGGVLDIKASWHADVSFKTLAWDAPYLTFARFWVPRDLKSEFEGQLHRWLPSMITECGRKVSHGWRLAGGWHDQDAENNLAVYAPELVGRFDHVDADDLEEWDLILPWNSSADWASEFDMGSFQHILKNVARLEVKHLQPMDLQSSRTETA